MPSESSLYEPDARVSSLWRLVRRVETTEGDDEFAHSGATSRASADSLPADGTTRTHAPPVALGPSGEAGSQGAPSVPAIPFSTAEGTRKWWDALNEVATSEQRQAPVEGLGERRRDAGRVRAADLDVDEADDKPVLRLVASS